MSNSFEDVAVMRKISKIALVALTITLILVIPSMAYANGNETETITSIEPEPISPDLVTGIIFMFWFLGIVIKAMMPYYRKLKAGEVKNFDVRYLWVFILNVVICLGQAVRSFGSEFSVLPAVNDTTTLVMVAVGALVVGAGLTWVFDELFKWFQFIKPEQAQTTS